MGAQSFGEEVEEEVEGGKEGRDGTDRNQTCENQINSAAQGHLPWERMRSHFKMRLASKQFPKHHTGMYWTLTVWPKGGGIM